MKEQLAACCQTTHSIHLQNLRQSGRLGLSTSRHEQSSRALSHSSIQDYPQWGMKNASVTAYLVALNHVPLEHNFDNMGINTGYRKKYSDCEIPPAKCEVRWSQSIAWPSIFIDKPIVQKIWETTQVYQFNSVASCKVLNSYLHLPTLFDIII